MPTPAYIIMDNLNTLGKSLRKAGRYEEALDVDSIIEAVNAAGHHYPGDREACVEYAERVIDSPALSLGTDVILEVREILDAAPL